MAWLDVRKQVFAYVLNRLKLFTSIDADQLEVSFWTASTLTLRDFEVDPKRLELPGITVRRAKVTELTISLGTRGVTVNAKDLLVSAAVNSVTPDLALSTFLEQTTADLAASIHNSGLQTDENAGVLADTVLSAGADDLGVGETSGIVARLADLALSQLHVSLANINLKLIVGDELDLSCHLNLLSAEGGHLSAEGLHISAISSDPVSTVDNNYEDVSIPKESSGNTGKNVRFSVSSSGEERTGSDDEAEQGMARSIYFDALSSLGSSTDKTEGLSPSEEQSDKMLRSSFFTEQQLDEIKAAVAAGQIPAEETIAWVSKLTLSYAIAQSSSTLTVDSVRISTLPFARIAVELLNVILTLPSSGGDDSRTPSRLHGTIDHLVFGLSDIDSEGMFKTKTETVDFQGITFSEQEFELSDLAAKGLQVSGPVLQATYADLIHLTVPHPVSLTFSVEGFGDLALILTQLFAIASDLQTIETSTPAKFRLELPDIRIQFGEVTLHVFPGALDEKGLHIRELLLTAGEDRVIVGPIDVDYLGDAKHDIVTKIQSLNAKLDDDMLRSTMELFEAVRLSTRNGVTGHSGSRKEVAPGPRVAITVHEIDIQSPDYTISGSLVFSYAEVTRLKVPIEVFSGDNRVEGTLDILQDSDAISIEVKELKGTLGLSLIGQSHSGQTEDHTGHVGNRSRNALIHWPLVFRVAGSVLLYGSSDLRLNFEANGSLRQNELSVNTTAATLTLIDDGADIQLLMAQNCRLTGSVRSRNFVSTVDALVLSTCADSLYVLRELVKNVMPRSESTIAYDATPTGDMNLWADIDNDAFGASPGHIDEALDMLEDDLPQNLSFMESFYASDLRTRMKDAAAGQSLDMRLEELADSTRGKQKGAGLPVEDLRIEDDYVMHTSNGKAVKTSDTHGVGRFQLGISHFLWNCYDGYDLKSTREELAAAMGRVDSEATRMANLDFPEREAPVLGDFMYNSIYIGSKQKKEPLAPQGKLESLVDEELGTEGLRRSQEPRMVLKAVGASMRHVSHDGKGLGDLLNRLTVEVDNLVVKDKVPSSAWDVFLGLQSSRSQREIGKPMLHLKWETVVAQMPEVRAYFDVLPLRFFIDQDTLDFLTRFFSFEGGVEQPSAALSEDGNSASALLPFFQRVEIMTLQIKVDYLPKKVDYSGLRSGRAGEFINLFPLEGSVVVLRHLIVRGVSGFESFWASLGSAWGSDIRANQLLDILVGYGPIRSIARIGSGVSDLVVIPVREYRRDGSQLTGLRRGTLVFAQGTAAEIYKLGAKMVKNSQGWLEVAERVLGGGLAPTVQTRDNQSADDDGQ